MDIAVGIDLGTTNSVVAVFRDGKPAVLLSQEGERTIPSVVAISPEKETLVGRVAKRQAVVASNHTISSAKRFIGKRFEQTVLERSLVPFEVRSTESGGAAFFVHSQVLLPEEVSALILKKLVMDAEAGLGQPVTKAVITVPAYFTDAQREATMRAAEIAGVEVLRIINEPTAAALAFGLTKGRNGNVLVFDLGGGTFDVSVLRITDQLCEVLSTSGDNFLGGDDIDRALLKKLVQDISEEFGIPETSIQQDSQALQRLREAAEQAKIDLSLAEHAQINLPFLTQVNGEPKNFAKAISRTEFENVVGPLIERCRKPLQNALTDAGLTTEDIDEVLLVGGSTRIPAVRRLVKEVFAGKEPSQSINPDEAVALGAAIQAGILVGSLDDVALVDVTPFSLGIETLGGKMTTLIERNTPIPATASQLFTTAEHFQRGADVVILQGEDRYAENNTELGRIPFEGIAKLGRGAARIEVTFEVDENGILTVRAEDLDAGHVEQLVIHGVTRQDRSSIQAILENFSRFRPR